MPFTFEAGVSYAGDQLSSVRMALDVNKKMGDRLTFEPAVDINIYKKILSLRLGYAFSDRDLKQFFQKLGGNEDDNYVKTNWNTFCTGLGFGTGTPRTAPPPAVGCCPGRAAGRSRSIPPCHPRRSPGDRPPEVSPTYRLIPDRAATADRRPECAPHDRAGEGQGRGHKRSVATQRNALEVSPGLGDSKEPRASPANHTPQLIGSRQQRIQAKRKQSDRESPDTSSAVGISRP